jgi:flagellin-specific chaperone FliS
MSFENRTGRIGLNRKPDSIPGKRRGARGLDSASPHQLVGMAYDFAIVACHRTKADQSEKAIVLLKEVMHSLGPEDSSELIASYDWCLDRIREGEFAPAAQMLADLRTAWGKAERSPSA